MYIVESKGGAIVCMLLALLFLGTWPALITLLERRGRLPQHTYLDYTITNLLAAVIIALTFGQIGDSTVERPNFFTQLSQDNWSSVLFAMAGGVVLSLGNLSTQYAWAFVGLSVVEVISSSMTVVIDPFVGCFLVAVCLASAVHSSNAADYKAKLSSWPIDNETGKGTVLSSASEEAVLKDRENGGGPIRKAKAGTATFLIELEKRRSIKVFGKSMFIGLTLTFFAGATNDQWHTLKEGVPKLVVYTAFFYFSVSCFIIALVLNISFLYHPALGVSKSWAFLAGFLCGFGNGLQFMGGQAAGYAAADAVQALPLVSTFWGVVLFGEYRRSSRRTYILLFGMLFMFIAAVGILMASSGHRK
ncbi:hypothetical protein ES288_A13G092400v1 [Gossypium darwinii]|uniref:Ureide permease n=1 Tax=Gossypium darwinii TaxID=34276 RepID=A0A5D2DXV6_GOSDA|nr:hypothetical protein ES288_A13G092400v1 [Gossypium darwinii]